MAALTGNKHTYMRQVIAMLMMRMDNYVDCHITHEDFLELFVPENQHEWATEVPIHFHLPYRTTNVECEFILEAGQTCSFNFELQNVWGRQAPMVPRKPLPLDVDHPRFAHIRAALEQYAEYDRQFSLATRVLQELDARCTSDSQMRFFWPTMLILMENSGDEATVKAAEKLRAARTPKVIPSLPEWLRQACRDTAGYVTAASLIPDKLLPSQEATVKIKRLSPFVYRDERVLCII